MGLGAASPWVAGNSVPSKAKGAPRHNPSTTSSASANRSRRTSSVRSRPNAAASGGVQPLPKPKDARPPVSTSPRGDLLGYREGMVQIETDDRAANTDAPGALPRSQREERRGGQVATVNPEMVLGKPDRGETEVLGRLDER